MCACVRVCVCVCVRAHIFTHGDFSPPVFDTECHESELHCVCIVYRFYLCFANLHSSVINSQISRRRLRCLAFLFKHYW